MCMKEVQRASEFAKQVIVNPGKALKKTATVKEATVYLATISVVSAVAIPVLYWLVPLLAFMSGYDSLIGLGILFVPFFIAMTVVGSLISAGIIQLFGKLFRILPKGYDRTYAAVAYAHTPSMLFGWIPIVNIVTGIWGIVLQVMGLKRQHGISTGKAILAIVVPIVVVAIIAGVVAGALAYWISGFVATGIYG